MREYKYIRVEMDVYEQIRSRLRPMESMSHCIRRLLDKLTILEQRVKTTAQIIEEKK